MPSTIRLRHSTNGFKEEDIRLKTFQKPAENKTGIYIYRNSFVGQALKKSIYINGEMIGESANKVYFYKEVEPGEQTLSTESEFSENDLKLSTEGGKNYFFEQYIKWVSLLVVLD